jgi:hypothetical protein
VPSERTIRTIIGKQSLGSGIPVLPGYRDSDPKEPSTYFSRTLPGDPQVDEPAQHHQDGKASKVVGRDGEVYPRVPADNPWHHNREDERARPQAKPPEAETDLVARFTQSEG